MINFYLLKLDKYIGKMCRARHFFSISLSLFSLHCASHFDCRRWYEWICRKGSICRSGFAVVLFLLLQFVLHIFFFLLFRHSVHFQCVIYTLPFFLSLRRRRRCCRLCFILTYVLMYTDNTKWNRFRDKTTCCCCFCSRCRCRCCRCCCSMHEVCSIVFDIFNSN